MTQEMCLVNGFFRICESWNSEEREWVSLEISWSNEIEY